MTDLAREIEELRGLPQSELVARYEALCGEEPHITVHAWLWRRLAWRLQEQRHGGLSETAKRRLDELMKTVPLSLDGNQREVRGQLPRSRATYKLPVGSAVEREWHGQNIRVLVVEGGFEWGGETYRSLSAVARAVTGAHWNGRAFFGLKKGARR